MQELRIDCANLTDDEAKKWKQEVKDIWKLNHSIPYSDEYNELLDKLIPNRGKNTDIRTPVNGVNLGKVKVGDNVVIMNGSSINNYSDFIKDLAKKWVYHFISNARVIITIVILVVMYLQTLTAILLEAMVIQHQHKNLCLVSL